MEEMNLLLLNRLCPPLAALTIGSLAIVSLLSSPRMQLAWRYFAAFCALLTAAALCATAVTNAPHWIPLEYSARLLPGLSLASLFFAVAHVAELVKLSDDTYLRGLRFGYHWTPNGPDIYLFGRYIPFRRYFTYSLGFWALLTGSLTVSPLGIASVSLGAERSIQIEPGPLLGVGVGVGLAALAKVNYFLLRACHRSDRKPRRQYLVASLLGFNLAYLPGMLANACGVWMGRAVQPVLMASLPAAVLVFYAGIVRYQFAQIGELNESLERRVQERTAELQQAQTRLVQSEKMASLGRLVAGIAHEVNNPLAAISSMQQSVSKTMAELRDIAAGWPSDPGGQELATRRISRLSAATLQATRVMSEGTARVVEVIHRLRRFARLDEATEIETDLRKDIEDAIELVRAGQPERGRAVEIRARLDSGRLLRCNARELSQVWLNLLLNAREALGDRSGLIEISTSERDEGCAIVVSDTGCGICPEHLEHIFDPGFTTKGSGVGTGLGLSICYQVVEDHGGRIHVESQPERGTSVRVLLPWQASPPKEPPAPRLTVKAGDRAAGARRPGLVAG